MGNLFGMFYTLQFVLLVACATFYYKAAEMERASGVLWAGLSVGIFLVTWRFMGWSYVGNLLGQGLLLGAITGLRIWRDRPDPD
jgi:hypothetical protein